MSSATTGWARWRAGWTLRGTRTVRWGVAAALGAIVLIVVVLVARSGPDLPEGVNGTLVFVSDRSGIDNLYARELPDGRDRRLTNLDEPTRDPALSPDGGGVAFTVGGRVAVVATSGGPVRVLTLGVDWRDATPSWRPDGQSLVVASRRSDTSPRDIHLLSLDPSGEPTRRPLTETSFLDESQPAVSPDGQRVVFVREDNLYRIDFQDPRPRRIAGGFRKIRSPRFLSSGRVLFLWTEAKEYGIDVVDVEGAGRETLHKGSTFYRSIAPSPDGRFLAATFTFDLGFQAWEALKLRQREDLRLLDRSGTPVAELAGSWRHANHSADWGR
jgi:Tol biopolymer transport system component